MGRRLRHVRIGALLLLLAFTAAWAGHLAWERRTRTSWTRPLEVGLVLLAPSGPGNEPAWREGAALLRARFGAEMARWRGPGPEPFQVTVVGPVRWTGSLPFAPEGDGFLHRVAHALQVFRARRDVDRAAGGATGGFDLHVYVLCVPPRPDLADFAEGSGALGGEVAFVRATCDGDVGLSLQAVGHELLHTLGASDKYDAAGHARLPQGLADPDRTPPFPQDHAEWMVGEVPLAPGRGRLPVSLEEMRVGPVTAREIGWIQ